MVISSLGSGGAETVFKTLFLYFKREIDVQGFALSCKCPQDPIFQEEEIFCLSSKESKAQGLFRLFLLFYKQRKDPEVCYLIFNPHWVVFLTLLKSILPGCDNKLVFRSINTLSISLGSHKSFVFRHIIRHVMPFALKRVDGVICQSQGMAKDLMYHFHLSEMKIRVIHNPVADRFSLIARENARHSSNINDSGYFLFVGKLEPQKRPDLLLEVYKSYLDVTTNPFRLLIIGAGSMKSQLNEMVEELLLKTYVDICDSCNALEYRYSRAVATLLVSKYEGFPNVLVESIACGTPVVAFDCPSGPREIVIDGVNGFLIQQDSVEKFVSAMQKISELSFPADGVAASVKSLNVDSLGREYLSFLG